MNQSILNTPAIFDTNISKLVKQKERVGDGNASEMFKFLKLNW